MEELKKRLLALLEYLDEDNPEDSASMGAFEFVLNHLIPICEKAELDNLRNKAEQLAIQAEKLEGDILLIEDELKKMVDKDNEGESWKNF